ncbi:LEA type 2 family protein [Winogradskyella echinorum]|uniref:LEA type 2 family protein n=1 Tax=Winogradskyella echinorum TaxID=538189 RepID=A0ABR6Y5Q2_9FLAO|nr:LEA type 2 family protein [Winogradskyella echinorum]MBC3848040.1 LEA type 2 family protein [Winogradskyella echinorum]MBC5752388.1 LEA type 2 family protein [Winogradskyella echinorum]
MFKRFLFISIFFTLLFNCTVTEQPEFIGLENIKVVNSNIQSITLKADALFINPNDVGGSLKTDDLKVYINETEVATVVSDEFDVPSKKNFTIPLIVSVATDSIIDKKSLGGLLGSLISQKLKVQYKGDIKYKVLGYSSTYSVDETQELKVKL